MSTKAKGRTATSPVVITANRLLDGQVVWLGTGESWVESLLQARVSAGEAAAEALALGHAAERAQLVVGVYAAEVALTPQGVQPVSQKERIRAGGPSTVVSLAWAA
jgi:sulfite reductase (NADPH) hemoprotein beta-component